jgi:uncharacterized protein
MDTILSKINNLNWLAINNLLHTKGYAQINSFIDENEANNLIDIYNEPTYFRKTIVMERYRFGLGEYKYFNYPLPEILQTIRVNIYPKLAEVANLWLKVLNIPTTYPSQLSEFLELCRNNSQTKLTVLILKYGAGGHNTLHQDLYGDVFFPIQLVLFLNEPEVNYTGGEFVLTEQIPRAQSKAIVLKPKKGDMLIFTTNFRPVKGTKGYYRVNMKHGVSEVLTGERHTLGIIFHDAI